MSTDQRLERLGLWHLRGDPVALKAAMEEKRKQSLAVQTEATAKRLAQREELRKAKPAKPPIA